MDVIEYRRRSEFFPYGLRMECRVTTQQEAIRSHSEALPLARDLNIVWAYVAVVPLFPKRLMIRVPESPDGWRSNFTKINSIRPTKPRSALASPGPPAGFRVSVTVNPGKYKVMLSFMPLQRALVALQAYRTANSNTRFLVNLHFGALDQLGTEWQLVLLAKALDLARDILPGHRNSDKQAALPVRVRTELTRSLDWLGEMSNKRLETRHVASKGELLPRLSRAEAIDFVHDADLVIRGVVERELGIAVVVPPIVNAAKPAPHTIITPQ